MKDRGVSLHLAALPTFDGDNRDITGDPSKEQGEAPSIGLENSCCDPAAVGPAAGIPNDPDEEFQCNWLHSNCGTGCSKSANCGYCWQSSDCSGLSKHAATFLVELIFCAAVKGAR
jgi:hypothetical protein